MKNVESDTFGQNIRVGERNIGTSSKQGVLSLRRRQIRQNLDCLACGMRGNFGSRATCRKCKKMNPARRQEGIKFFHLFDNGNLIFSYWGVKIDLTKAKTDYVLRQNHEAKQKAVLRECKKQQKAAEKRRANQHRQVIFFFSCFEQSRKRKTPFWLQSLYNSIPPWSKFVGFLKIGTKT